MVQSPCKAIVIFRKGVFKKEKKKKAEEKKLPRHPVITHLSICTDQTKVEFIKKLCLCA